ncbi:hypothetical protein BC829DRAFT_381845 [Chytridium lagenaria]|nr:hypothetical protein BC829DRAFT_381845 [Chytridium lagenaria]
MSTPIKTNPHKFVRLPLPTTYPSTWTPPPTPASEADGMNQMRGDAYTLTDFELANEEFQETARVLFKDEIREMEGEGQSDTCLHLNTTKQGSNQYQSIIRCKDCRQILSKTVHPKPAFKLSVHCAHTTTTREGSNQYYERIKCKDCGVLLKRNKVCAHEKVTRMGRSQVVEKVRCDECGVVVEKQREEVVAVGSDNVVGAVEVLGKEVEKVSIGKKSTCLIPTAGCTHTNIAKAGSNQHVSREKCLDCGAYSTEWANPKDRMNGVQGFALEQSPIVMAASRGAETVVTVSTESCTHPNQRRRRERSGVDGIFETCLDCHALTTGQEIIAPTTPPATPFTPTPAYLVQASPATPLTPTPAYLVQASTCAHIRKSRRGTNQSHVQETCLDYPGSRMTGIEKLGFKAMPSAQSPKTSSPSLYSPKTPTTPSPSPAVSSISDLPQAPVTPSPSSSSVTVLAQTPRTPSPSPSPSPQTPLAIGKDTCQHVNISMRGSNQYQTKKTCIDCKQVLCVVKRVATPVKEDVSTIATTKNILMTPTTLVADKTRGVTTSKATPSTPTRINVGDSLRFIQNTPSTAVAVPVYTDPATPSTPTPLSHSQNPPTSQPLKTNARLLDPSTCGHKRLMDAGDDGNDKVCRDCGDMFGDCIKKEEEEVPLRKSRYPIDKGCLPLSTPAVVENVGNVKRESRVEEEVCQHLRTSKKGSNKYVMRVKCVDCEEVLVDDRK